MEAGNHEENRRYYGGEEIKEKMADTHQDELAEKLNYSIGQWLL